MSIVPNMAKAAATQSFAMLGAETVVIDGTSISCVLDGVTDSRDAEAYGFEKTAGLTAVCKTVDMPATSILKKRAVARSQNFTVSDVDKGGTFTTINLTTDTRG